ncbi:MAG: DUF1653 domain-containing protein [Candidatus Nomurabacteria bacterium]|jgi:hypothetical protein|nr:DUF1653 domain-containing protein [Candidatus Nomurabacteria bacterium]
MTTRDEEHAKLRAKITEIKTQIEIGAEYEHYKGDHYRVVDVAIFSEDIDRIFVIYEALYNGLIWARPYRMWNELVEIDGKKILRFRKVEK